MDEIKKHQIGSTPSTDGAHEERDELVPLAEPDEHGRIRPPDLASAPPAGASSEVRTSTVVTDRYVAPGSSAPAPPAVALEAVINPPIIKPGFPGSNTLIVAAAILTIAAVGLSGYFAPSQAVVRALATLYDIALHTGTGVVAVLVASIFTERKFNDIKLGASRMYFLVALFYTVFNTNVPIPTKTDELVLAVGVYTLALWGLFRLPRHELSVIGITHAGLWLIVKLGSTLEGFITPPPAA